MAKKANTPKNVPAAKEKKVSRRVVLACIGVFILLSGLFTAFFVRNEILFKKVEYYYMGVLQHDNLYTIDVDAKEQSKMVRNTKRHGSKGTFTYFCDSEISFYDATSYGVLRFGSVDSNKCDLVATILDAKGHLLWQSDGIQPGYYVSQIRLHSTLEPGTYNCRLYVTGYGKDNTGHNIGVQYTPIKLIVGEGYNG